MIRDHFEAVRARLNSDPALAGKGFDSIRVNDRGELERDTYWVLSSGEATFPVERLAATQATGSAESVLMCRVVSPSADAIRVAIDKVSLLLRGWRPQITGRNCSAVTVEVFDVTPDVSIRPPLFYADVEITLHSSAA